MCFSTNDMMHTYNNEVNNTNQPFNFDIKIPKLKMKNLVPNKFIVELSYIAHDNMNIELISKNGGILFKEGTENINVVLNINSRHSKEEAMKLIISAGMMETIKIIEADLETEKRPE